MNILLIGSSVSRGVGGELRRLYREIGERPKVSTLQRPGQALHDHVQRDQDGNLVRDEEGDLILKKRTRKKLQQRHWDWVILQDRVTLGIDVKYSDEREALLQEIKKDINTHIAFFMTYRSEKHGLPTETSYQTHVRGNPNCTMRCNGYIPLAKQVQGRIAPVGEVIENFKLKGLDVSSLFGDGHHPNKRGTYLVAYTMFVALNPDRLIDVVERAPNSVGEDGPEWREIVCKTITAEPDNWGIPLPAGVECKCPHPEN